MNPTISCCSWSIEVQVDKIKSLFAVIGGFCSLVIDVQYCAKVMRMNFDEFRRKVSKTFENERYFEPNEFSLKFRCFFETAIVLPFAKNRANPRKVMRNFERHFTDSIEFSQLNSKRASKFRRLFRKVLKKFEDCFEISKSALDSKIVTAALLITEMQSACLRTVTVVMLP